MEILKEDLLQNSLDRHSRNDKNSKKMNYQHDLIFLHVLFYADPIPKKSTFGKNRMLLSMDLAKMEVDLKNSSDQEVRKLIIFVEKLMEEGWLYF